MQKSLHLYSVCLHSWRVPQFALKCCCDPPPPPRETVTWRPPPPQPTGGDFKGAGGRVQHYFRLVDAYV